MLDFGCSGANQERKRLAFMYLPTIMLRVLPPASEQHAVSAAPVLAPAPVAKAASSDSRNAVVVSSSRSLLAASPAAAPALVSSSAASTLVSSLSAADPPLVLVRTSSTDTSHSTTSSGSLLSSAASATARGDEKRALSALHASKQQALPLQEEGKWKRLEEKHRAGPHQQSQSQGQSQKQIQRGSGGSRRGGGGRADGDSPPRSGDNTSPRGHADPQGSPHFDSTRLIARLPLAERAELIVCVFGWQ